MPKWAIMIQTKSLSTSIPSIHFPYLSPTLFQLLPLLSITHFFLCLSSFVHLFFGLFLSQSFSISLSMFLSLSFFPFKDHIQQLIWSVIIKRNRKVFELFFYCIRKLNTIPKGKRNIADCSLMANRQSPFAKRAVF